MDYYAVLNIDPLSTDTEIKSAYRQMAVKYHPDKNMEERTDAEVRFKLISEAYQVLSDPVKRKAYDSKRHRRRVHANAMSTDYDVVVDDFGQTIHDMSIHNLGRLDDVFSQNLTPFFD